RARRRFRRRAGRTVRVRLAHDLAPLEGPGAGPADREAKRRVSPAVSPATGGFETGIEMDRHIYLVLGIDSGLVGRVRQARASGASAARAENKETVVTQTQSPARRDEVVVVRRRLRAAREFVFQAWTDPRRFARWFGPKTWTVERCELDPQTGGSW